MKSASQKPASQKPASPKPASPKPAFLRASLPHLCVLGLSIAAIVGSAALSAPRAQAASAPGLATGSLPPFNQFAAGDLDRTRNACSDFGGFVNGRWLAANPVPGDRTSWGAFEMLAERSIAVQKQLAERAAGLARPNDIEKIVGDFWATGMDEMKINGQGLEPLKSRLRAIDRLDDGEDVAEYVREAYARGEVLLFGFGPSADFKDSSMNIAYASQGGLGLPDPSYYRDDKQADKLAAYRRHIANLLVLAGETREAATERAKQVVAIETRLAAVSKTSEELSRDVALYYNPVSPAEADAISPNFPWSEFFEEQGIDPPAMFSLAMPGFHAEVSKMLSEVPAEHWRSYIRFHTLDSASPYLSEAFSAEHFDFYRRALRGQKQDKPRWKRVLDTVEAQAGEALGQMYVDVAFPAESKARMEALVGNLSQALKLRLEGLEWMSPATRRKALEKWATFTPKIGYPDKWRDFSDLDTSRDSYIGNVLAANAFNYRWNLEKIGKPVDRSEWGMSPQTVNAYYNPQQNEIVFPAAILQPPCFDANADDALSYGGIGAVIGHEMIHGYDDQGSRFGPNGNFENWWTEADAKGFVALTAKLVAQFDAYEVAPGKRVNGTLTLGENIADLGGLAVAYDAMKRATAGAPDPMVDGLSRDQRFFLNWGTVWRRGFTPEELNVRLVTDSHAPANFRAIGAPSNHPAFAAAFQCKAGDAMVREGEQRILIW